MAINPALYMHEQDKLALKALQSIPGFTPALKAFLNVWNEQQFRIENMSSNLRLGPQQMPEYYNMLPPICETLGIEIPELFLTLDVRPNAYTYGDTSPFIVMTSGLLETLPAELIPSVLAHECGHIACRHVLYTTMGHIFLSGTDLLGLGNLISGPLKIAFYHWMRCSEYSADRAAAICGHSADNVVKTCMHFSGFDKDFDIEGNVNAFMAQAEEYLEMTRNSAWNKTLEFYMFAGRTHPLSAVRAYECDKWGKSDDFLRIQQFLAGRKADIPIWDHGKSYIGRDFAEVVTELKEIGFRNIKLVQATDKPFMAKPRQVLHILPAGDKKLLQRTWFSPDIELTIVYFTPNKPGKKTS